MRYFKQKYSKILLSVVIMRKSLLQKLSL